MKEFCKYYFKKMISGLLRVFWIFPVKSNKILFINEHSYTFSDNLKYLSLYLNQNNRENTCKYDLYFSLKDSKGLNEPYIKPVKIFSIYHFYHALTSSVLFTNAGGISYLPIRRNQLVISTWHGGGPYKVTGVDAIPGYWYEKETQYNAKKVNYILSSCKVFTEQEAPGMYYKPEQIVNCGMPRMDFFFDESALAQMKKKVFDEYNIPLDSKLVIYMPTFRGIFEDYSGVIADDILELDYKGVVDTLQERFGGDWVFAVRLHPRLKDIHFKNNDLINMSLYPDSEELLMAADVLITDYSSVMWDFSFSKKPIFLFATDINDYETRRGFYMSPDKWPFPIATNNEEMKEIITNFDNNTYQKSLKNHYIDAGSYEQGIACETVKEMIDKHIEKISK